MRIPLGHIQLENGAVPVYPMSNLLMNFVFDDRRNWEILRLMMNILLGAYIRRTAGTVVRLIEDEIVVRTQFAYHMKNLHSPKVQDVQIEEVNLQKYTYIEVQAKTGKAIGGRPGEYSLMSIRQNPGKISNQIWLLGEDSGELLPDGAFSNYVLTDEATGFVHPVSSSVMYIGLPRLSKETGTPEGELAAFLLGKISKSKNSAVSRIIDAFKRSCAKFCARKGVKKMYSRMELWQMEIEDEIMAEGVAKGSDGIVAKIEELINSGLSHAEVIARVVTEHKANMELANKRK